MKCSLKNNRDNTKTNTMWVTCPYNKVITKMFGSCSSYSGRSHQWCVSLTPNNTKAIERMTCHCFLWPISRDLTSSSYRFSYTTQMFYIIATKKQKNPLLHTLSTWKTLVTYQSTLNLISVCSYSYNSLVLSCRLD